MTGTAMKTGGSGMSGLDCLDCLDCLGTGKDLVLRWQEVTSLS